MGIETFNPLIMKQKEKIETPVKNIVELIAGTALIIFIACLFQFLAYVFY